MFLFYVVLCYVYPLTKPCCRKTAILSYFSLTMSSIFCRNFGGAAIAASNYRPPNCSHLGSAAASDDVKAIHRFLRLPLCQVCCGRNCAFCHHLRRLVVVLLWSCCCGMSNDCVLRIVTSIYMCG